MVPISLLFETTMMLSSGALSHVKTLALLKFQAQDLLGSIANLYPLVYAPADNPQDMLGGADNRDSLPPGTRDFGVNHELT